MVFSIIGKLSSLIYPANVTITRTRNHHGVAEQNALVMQPQQVYRIEVKILYQR